MNCFIRGITFASALIALAAHGWASPLVLNPSFEMIQIGAPFASSNPANIPSWTHTGSTGDGLLWGIGYSDGGGSVTVAGNGNQFVTLGGGFTASGTATWSQAIPGFTVGAMYTLGFMLAGEGTFSDTQTVTAKATGVGTTMNNFNAPISPANYWRNWQPFSLQFTADATTETISFSSTTQFDVGLDNVSVTQVSSAVPEPGTWALLSIGMVALALRRRP